MPKVNNEQITLTTGETALGNATATNINTTGFALGLGDIHGFYVKYNTTTSVTVVAGAIEANSEFYTSASDATHNMTSLAAGFDHHYIYIDDSASTAPTAVIIDSTTEPAWSDTKQGWYNGDDKCIDTVVSPATGSVVAPFSTEVISDKNIRHLVDMDAFAVLGAGMNPDGSWQTPNNVESSVVVPVNATAIFINIGNTDAGGVAIVYATNSELAALVTIVSDGSIIREEAAEEVATKQWVTLGNSRNIKIAGSNEDDNNLSAECSGFSIAR